MHELEGAASIAERMSLIIRHTALQNSIRLAADLSRSSAPVNVVVKRSKISGSPKQVQRGPASRRMRTAFLRVGPRREIERPRQQ